MRRNILSAIAVLFSLYTFAQNKHITYIGEIYTVSMKQAAGKNSKSNYSVEKGYHHILVFKDKKAISLRRDTIMTNNDSILGNMSRSNFLSLFDKNQNATKTTTAYYNKKADKVFFSDYKPDVWRKIAPDKRVEIIDAFQQDIISTMVAKGMDTSFMPPKIEYTDKVKTIKGYNCKNAIVTDNKKVYYVWFTEEINYNWCFDDYRFLIPGTVIYIEYDSKPYLEFVSIEDLDYNKIPLDKKIVTEVLKKW
jgi:GLPGLI family protein